MKGCNMNTVLLDSLINKKISDIGRICDLISVCFNGKSEENRVYLHIQSFFRIIKNNKVIVCSDDMYRCHPDFENEEFEWDAPGKSVYDVSLSNHYDILRDSAIISVIQSPCKDLTIIFENDIEIQIIINSTDSEEKYRIFNDEDTIEIVD
jgi:hypothetical protein